MTGAPTTGGRSAASQYGENRRLWRGVCGAQARRIELAARGATGSDHRIDAVLEPTVPIVARPRGTGYDEPFTDIAEIAHYWNWSVLGRRAAIGRRRAERAAGERR